VQILAAVQEQAPGMPDVDASHMGTLKTLGQIVEYMQGLMGTPNPTPPKPGAPTPTATTTPAPVAHTTLTDHAELGRYALELAPAPAVGLAQTGLLGTHEVLITGDNTGLATALAAEFKQRGVQARATDTVDPDAKAVIFVGGLRPVSNATEAANIQREGYRVARTVAKHFTENGGLFVTVQDTGGAFGTTPFAPERAYLAGLPALVKTASQEWPTASLKAIDLQRNDRDDATLAIVLADELLLGGGDLEVGLPADGTRLVTRSVAAPVVRGNAPLAEKDAVIVSGGARGVTAACVIQWAKETQARFVLLGRSALMDEPACCAGITDDAGLKRALLTQAKTAGQKLSPADLSNQVRGVMRSREIRATLEAIAATGSEARYRSVDVTNTTALATVLEETRTDWGPIRALVHGAGVLADRLIVDQTDAQFDHIFDTKVEGLRALFGALTQDPLKVIGLFSSVSARCGNNGQSTYAMANETLNKIAWAESRARGGDVLVKSFGWGPWEGGMVNP